MAEPVALYADGGVIAVNPSPLGGTWAWCLVDAAGERVQTASGVLTAAENGQPVTNNVSELYALVAGLEALPARWCGTVYSDSWVSLQRVFLAAPLKGVPHWLRVRLHIVQRTGRLAKLPYVLLDGHPTKAQLAAGVGKRGKPVSEQNVWCDAACTAQARAYMEAHRDLPSAPLPGRGLEARPV